MGTNEQVDGDEKDAAPGGKYTCAGCKTDYLTVHDAIACCSNEPAVFSPRTGGTGSEAPAPGKDAAYDDEDRQATR